MLISTIPSLAMDIWCVNSCLLYSLWESWSKNLQWMTQLAFGTSTSLQGNESNDCLFNSTMTAYIATNLHYLEAVPPIHSLEDLLTVNRNSTLPRFLVLMFLRPTRWSAPAPRISWQVRELNVCQAAYTITHWVLHYSKVPLQMTCGCQRWIACS